MGEKHPAHGEQPGQDEDAEQRGPHRGAVVLPEGDGRSAQPGDHGRGEGLGELERAARLALLDRVVTVIRATPAAKTAKPATVAAARPAPSPSAARGP